MEELLLTRDIVMLYSQAQTHACTHTYTETLPGGVFQSVGDGNGGKKNINPPPLHSHTDPMGADLASKEIPQSFTKPSFQVLSLSTPPPPKDSIAYRGYQQGVGKTYVCGV